jgi:hypothetical protein
MPVAGISGAIATLAGPLTSGPIEAMSATPAS